MQSKKLHIFYLLGTLAMGIIIGVGIQRYIPLGASGSYTLGKDKITIDNRQLEPISVGKSTYIPMKYAKLTGKNNTYQTAEEKYKTLLDEKKKLEATLKSNDKTSRELKNELETSQVLFTLFSLYDSISEIEDNYLADVLPIEKSHGDTKAKQATIREQISTDLKNSFFKYGATYEKTQAEIRAQVDELKKDKKISKADEDILVSGLTSLETEIGSLIKIAHSMTGDPESHQPENITAIRQQIADQRLNRLNALSKITNIINEKFNKLNGTSTSDTPLS